MFRSKIIISIFIFLIFLIITSIIKNKTRIVEKKIYYLKLKISSQKKDINESQLDFYFLSSPAKIEKKIKKIGQYNYSPIKNSKIFLSVSDFTDIQKKLSKFKNKDDKKTKKN
tara:strand:- start:72 stop:410 length:339 start_codon:yes stop_codon:yes gene_type:complete